MERDYSSSSDVTGVTYFIGNEIEHTLAFGKKTLFVVGIQDADEIIEMAVKNNVEHIYLGANQSFEITGEHGTDAEQAGWDLMVNLCIGAGYLVTLDFDLEDLEWVQESGYSENNNFIPMISVKVPYIEQLGYNANIKIDDVDFNATNNPNLYCINVDDAAWATTNQYFWSHIDLQHYFSNNCSGTGIEEQTTNKELLKVIDLLGRETKQTNQCIDGSA